MTATRPRKIPLPTLQEAARLATRTALEPCERIPDGVELKLGTFWEQDEVVCELYIAKDRPKDAVILTEARVNRHGGQVRSVRVFEEAMATAAVKRNAKTKDGQLQSCGSTNRRGFDNMKNQNLGWREALAKLAKSGKFLANWKLKNGAFLQMYIPRIDVEVVGAFIPNSGVEFSDIVGLTILRKQKQGALVAQNDIDACLASFENIKNL